MPGAEAKGRGATNRPRSARRSPGEAGGLTTAASRAQGDPLGEGRDKAAIGQMLFHQRLMPDQDARAIHGFLDRQRIERKDRATGQDERLIHGRGPERPVILPCGIGQAGVLGDIGWAGQSGGKGRGADGKDHVRREAALRIGVKEQRQVIGAALQVGGCFPAR